MGEHVATRDDRSMSVLDAASPVAGIDWKLAILLWPIVAIAFAMVAIFAFWNQLTEVFARVKSGGANRSSKNEGETPNNH
jgi:hypothetical protein